MSVAQKTFEIQIKMYFLSNCNFHDFVKKKQSMKMDQTLTKKLGY